MTLRPAILLPLALSRSFELTRRVLPLFAAAGGEPWAVGHNAVHPREARAPRPPGGLGAQVNLPRRPLLSAFWSIWAGRRPGRTPAVAEGHLEASEARCAQGCPTKVAVSSHAMRPSAQLSSAMQSSARWPRDTRDAMGSSSERGGEVTREVGGGQGSGTAAQAGWWSRVAKAGRW